MTEFKKCSKCKEEKSIEHFGVDSRRKDGRAIYCKPCNVDISRAWRSKPENKAKHAKSVEAWRLSHPEQKRQINEKARSGKMYHLKKYGITVEEYLALLEEQGYVCKICKKVNKDNKSLAVDHDHTTGKIRGLLCTKCNTYLGYINDDVEVLKQAVMYLEREA